MSKRILVTLNEPYYADSVMAKIKDILEELDGDIIILDIEDNGKRDKMLKASEFVLGTRPLQALEDRLKEDEGRIRDSEISRIEGYCREFNHNYSTIHAKGERINTIIGEATRQNVDLIITDKHQREAIKSFFLKNHKGKSFNIEVF